MMTRAQAYSALQIADTVWSMHLRTMFNKKAGDVRYTKVAEGEPGTPLRAAYDRYVSARDAWYDITRSEAA